MAKIRQKTYKGIRNSAAVDGLRAARVKGSTGKWVRSYAIPLYKKMPQKVHNSMVFSTVRKTKDKGAIIQKNMMRASEKAGRRRLRAMPETLRAARG